WVSPHEIMWVIRDFPGKVTGQQPRLHLQQSPHRYAISEHGVSHFLIEPALIGGDNRAPRMWLEVDGRACGKETIGLYLAVVDGLDYGRVGEDRPEWLHHIESERWPAKPWLVIKTEI